MFANQHAKPFDLTSISVLSEYNNGDFEHYTGKCLFISLYDALKKSNVILPSKNEFIHSLIMEAGMEANIYDDKRHDIPCLMENEKILSIFKTNYYLVNFRIEFYSGIKTSQTIRANPEPNIVFNKHVIDPRNVIRIVNTYQPDHFEHMLNPQTDFFNPACLNLSHDAYNRFLQQKITMQESIFRENQIRQDEIIARKFKEQDEELARKFKEQQIKNDEMIARKFKEYEEELARKKIEQQIQDDEIFAKQFQDQL